MHAWFVYLYIFGVWSCFVGKVESYSVVLSRNNIDNRRVYLAVLRSLRMLRRFLLMVDVILVFCPIKRHIENAYGVGKQNGLFFFLQMNCNKLVMLTILSNYVIRVFFTFCLVLKPLAVVGF